MLDIMMVMKAVRLETVGEEGAITRASGFLIRENEDLVLYGYGRHHQAHNGIAGRFADRLVCNGC